MKHNLKFLINGFSLLFILLFNVFTNTKGQDCEKYLYMMNNAEIQMTLYDKKDAISGIQTWKITNVAKDANGYSSRQLFILQMARERKLPMEMVRINAKGVN